MPFDYFRVISEYSAGRLSLDQSSSFLMEGAQLRIEEAGAKVHHRPYSFEDGSVVYPANAIDSCLRGD